MVLNPSPRTPLLCKFWMSLLFNTPDSDHQLVRKVLHARTVLRLTASSLHSVHCSLLSEHGKSIPVYFISEHSCKDFRYAVSSRTDKTYYRRVKCDIIYSISVNDYNVNSHLVHFNALLNGTSWRNIMYSPLHRALVVE